MRDGGGLLGSREEKDHEMILSGWESGKVLAWKSLGRNRRWEKICSQREEGKT